MKKLDLQKIIREEIKKALTEVVATKDDLDKIGDFIMSSSTFEYASPSKIKSAIKDMNDEWKAVSRNYKSIEEYFEDYERDMGDTQFMESKKLSKKKKSLKEGYAWERGERKFGEPLPTLASIQAAHQAKHNITEKSLKEGAILSAIKPGLQGEVKTAVQALETMLANQLTTAGLARNARELAELVIDIIDAAKDEQRNEPMETSYHIHQSGVIPKSFSEY